MVRSSSYWRKVLGVSAALAACALGCADVQDGSLEPASSALTVPVPKIGQYVVLASHGITLDDRALVLGGDLGVSPSGTSSPSSLTVGHDSRVGLGQVLLAQKIVLDDRTIAGELGANVIVAPRAKTGPRSAYVAPPAPPSPGAFTAGTAGVDVSRGRTRSLAPGKYGSVDVDGKLFLTGGVYELKSLSLGNDADLVALAGATVRIVGGLRAGNRASLGPASSRSGDLRIMVAGTLDGRGTSVSLGHDCRLRAVVVASGKVDADDRLLATGAIAARDVSFGHDCKLIFDGGFDCSTGVSCDDGNACTADACADAQCTHKPVADGTSCNDGNACTQGDRCQGGTCSGGGAVACPPGDQCHLAGVCNPATGVCSSQAKPDGTACDDGNACTQPDRCSGGVCAGAALPNCPATQADLALAKAVDQPLPQVGGAVTFTIALANLGPGGATGVQVADLLPAGLSFVSATPSQGSFSAATGVWAVGSVAVGASPALQLVALVAAPGPQTNIAAVTAADQTDPNTANNSASATVMPQMADLAIAETVDQSTPQVGDAVTFTIALSNAGPGAATGVQVTDLLPAGLSLVSATPSQGSFDSTTGLWIVGGLAPGGSQTLQLVATVASPAAQTNTAVISHADQFDPSTGNNAASATETPQRADVALTKTVDRATARAGEAVTFTVTVSNNGPGAGTGVQVTDVLPAGLTFVSATPSQGSYSAATGRWNAGSVAAGGSQTLQLVALIAGTGSITNTAVVERADELDPDTGNNAASASLTATAAAADLALTKTVDIPSPQVGGVVTFTVTLANNGPGVGNGVRVSDLLPAGLSFVSATPSQGSYDAATGSWLVGSVPAGVSRTLQVTAQVLSPTPVTNTASIAGADQDDPNPANDTASATESPQRADLAIAKTIDDPTASVGDLVTFTLTLSNNGPDAGTNVRVSDALPAGLTFVSATPAQGAYDSLSGLWAVGTIAAGGSATLQLVAEVASPSTLTNTASIAHADQFDPDLSNNSASATETPEQVDLAVTKVTDRVTAAAGENVTFTVTLRNDGPGGATSVQVTDVLPAGLTFVSATPSVGTYAGATGVWSVGDVGPGASRTLQVVAQMTGTSAVTNTATISGVDQFDPNPANNSASVTVGGVSQPADLAIGNSVDIAMPNLNNVILFTLTLSNVGPNDATDVQVTDMVPPGLAFVSASPQVGTYDPSTGRWTLGTVAVGDTPVLFLRARVVNPTPGTNTATITHADQTDPNPANNQSSATWVPQLADLALAETVNNPTPAVGSNVAFTVTLTNNGPSSATTVQVTDRLPAGLTFVSATPSQGSYDESSGLWNVGTVAAGTTRTLQLVATVASVDAATNTASVTRSAQFDPSTANNSASVNLTPQ
jgi:uncharacterized repeat protein (TIGR01451 family)